MDVQSEMKRRARRRRLLAARRYRSRRFWRTISRRRRTFGLVILLVLVGLLWAGYYYTRPQRVERLAEDYLTNLTGRHVTIDDAHFSPFEGIVLQKVKVYPPEDEEGQYFSGQQPPIFTADEVLLELAPGSIFRGKLEVTRIVAQRPDVYVFDDAQDPENQPHLRRMPTGWQGDLPVIELREGQRIEAVLADDGTVQSYRRMEFAASLRPEPGRRDRYQMHLRLGKAGRELYTGTGPLEVPIKGFMSFKGLLAEELPLPTWVEQRRRFLGLRGQLDVRFDFDEQTGTSSATITLRGASMVLPLGGFDKLSTQPDLKDVDETTPVGQGINLSDLRGTIVVEQQRVAAEPGQDAQPRQDIRFDQVTCKLAGQRIALNGRYEGLDSEAPFELRLSAERFDIPSQAEMLGQLTGSLDTKYGAVLHDAIREVYRDYQPAGPVDLNLTISRAVRGASPDYVGSVQLLDAAATYRHYPYRMENLTGEVRFAFTSQKRRVDIENVRGHRDGVELAVGGYVNVQGNWDRRIEVRGKNVRFGPRTRAALGHEQPQYVDLMRSLRMGEGTADFECIVTRPDKPDAREQVDLTIHPKMAEITYEHFPYPVILREGEITYRNDVVRMKGLRVQPAHVPYDDENMLALILVDGHYMPTAAGPELKLELVSASMVLDDKLWAAMPKQSAETLAQYHITGRARTVGTVVQVGEGDMTFDFSGDMSEGRLLYDGFPYQLEDITGKVHVTPARVELSDVKARHGGVPIVAEGAIGLAESEKTALSIRSDRMPLDNDLFKALPAGGQEAWRSFSPRGWVGLDVSIEQPAAPADAADAERPELAVITTVTCLGNGIRYTEFPYPLDNVTGQIVIRPDRVELVELTDVAGPRRIEMSGTVWPERDNSNLARGEKPQPKFKVSVLAEGMAFDETLRRSVPWRVRRQWNDILPTGSFDLALDSLAWTPLGETGRWDYAGQMEMRNLRALLGIRVEQFNGTLKGRGVLVPGQAAGFVGQLAASGGIVAGHRVERINANVVQDARTGRLLLDDLTGRLYDGQISGQVQIDLSEDNTPYAISLAGREIDLARMINANRDAEEPTEVSGRMNGRIAIAGKAGLGQKRGRGELEVRRASIYKLPPVLQLFNAGNLARKAAPSQAARLAFHFDGDHVTLEQVVLRDPSISLMGTGEMDWATKSIDVTLVAGEPSAGATDTMKVLEEFFSGASEELMKYRVSGSFSDPKVEAIPLSTLREAIEELTRARRRYQKGRQGGSATEPSQPK